MSESVKVGRLAMRHEGKMWNAYYAMPGTMEDAIPLGGIQISLITQKVQMDRFMNCMREFVADMIEEQVGVRPTWGGPEVAPETERAGHS